MQARHNLFQLKFAQLLLTGVAAFFCHPAFADFTVEDQGRVLEELARGPLIPFEQAMTCQQNVKFSARTESCQVKCNPRFCQSECKSPESGSLTYELVTEECTEDSVAVYGSNGFSAILTKTDYLAGGSTWLLGLLKNLSLFLQPEGKIILRNVWTKSFKELNNGETLTFWGPVVDADIEILPGTQTLRLEIGLDPRAHGLGQIVWLRLNEHEIFLKRKGILSVGP